ncbi:MAG: DUF1232 domain-containing protein [Thermodesulfobacteriota bacterium]|jgi:uncharacterized membrane protein YkvA (DUF1232 family)
MRSARGVSTLQFLRLLWHLPNFAKLYWRLFTDRRVPLHAKAVLLAGVLYVLSPVDLIPFLLFPVLGAVDDLTIFLLAARVFISLCPPDVVQEQVKKISQE